MSIALLSIVSYTNHFFHEQSWKWPKKRFNMMTYDRNMLTVEMHCSHGLLSFPASSKHDDGHSLLS
ncbi:hypothetical protein C4D60_Mb01t33450 [Musa balbisiana]|uniref:Uncharacterized protein n=1 Tax=Musa balbisiana TaxID=52838 RepID=A0A4S8JSJ2_MUSBA|nr:hypothetical protein C4D60_Mb01t33450 [Musa balbisiana]